MGFVVPDHQVKAAVKALFKDPGDDLTKGFSVCSVADCCYSIAEYELLPDTHLHINAGGFDFTPPPLFIFSQSRILWALPPLDERYLPPPFGEEQTFLRTVSPHYVLTTDATVCPPKKYESMTTGKPIARTYNSGLGVWDESLYPALVPKPYLAGEAYVRLVICHLWTNKELMLEKRMLNLGIEQENEEFYSFDDMDPLMRETVQPGRTSKRQREVSLALARQLGHDNVVEMLEHADYLDEMYP